MNQENQPKLSQSFSESTSDKASEVMAMSSSYGGNSQAVYQAAFPTASLYVGELSPDVNESMLFELFSQIGPVASIRVCRDAVTRRSLGYAYVNFHSMLDGERALDTLNYTMIKGQPCRIMWSQRDPSLRRSGHGNIFIKDLEKSIDNKALHDTFSAFGNILSCKVVTDEHGNSKGYGFVHFETQESADMAIEKVNGMLLNDKKVFVGRHISRRERISKKEESKTKFTNVYVKNLDSSIDDKKLHSLFSRFGGITSAVVQKDENTHQSKGFGFVNFADYSSASAAVAEMNGRVVNDKELYVCRAQSRAERAEELRRQFEAYRQERLAKYQGVNLYVKNLDESVEDQMLKEEFSSFGNVVSCKVMRDEKNISKGFGFVCFSTPEEAIKAQAEMNGKLIAGKPIFVAMAQRKEERRIALESQFSQRLGYLRSGIMGITSHPSLAGQVSAGAIPPVLFYHPQHLMQGGRMPYPPIPPQVLYNPVSRRVSHPRPVTGGSTRASGLTAVSPSQFTTEESNRSGGSDSNQRRAFGQRQRGVSSFPHQKGGKASSKGKPMGSPQQPTSSTISSGMRNSTKYNSELSPPQYNSPINTDSVMFEALASASPETQKCMIGELLYSMVEAREPDNAAKITGMLLELDNLSLLQLLESPDLLSSKVSQASQMLLNASSDE